MRYKISVQMTVMLKKKSEEIFLRKLHKNSGQILNLLSRRTSFVMTTEVHPEQNEMILGVRDKV